MTAISASVLWVEYLEDAQKPVWVAYCAHGVKVNGVIIKQLQQIRLDFI